MAGRWPEYKYNLTVGDLEEMLKAQNHRCLGCGRRAHSDLVNIGGEKKSRSKLGLVIDHDHNTGEVRGLLCNGCNIALGQCRDDPEVLRALADYLERDKI